MKEKIDNKKGFRKQRFVIAYNNIAQAIGSAQSGSIMIATLSIAVFAVGFIVNISLNH